MPRLHTIQRPTNTTTKTAKPAKPGRPAKPGQITKREITAQDAPKIAIGAGLLLALLGAGWFNSGKLAAQHEEERMMKYMQLETGVISADIDPNLSPAEADEAQQELQDNDPNFKA